MKTRITVNIGDETYNLVADENEQYMRKVAGYVAARAGEAAPGVSMSAAQRLVLTAMNIADEHLRLRAAYDELKLTCRRLGEENAALKAGGDYPVPKTGLDASAADGGLHAAPEKTPEGGNGRNG